MVFFRYPVKEPGDNRRLVEPLHFKTSNVKTRNRLLKAGLSEQLCPWDPKDPKTSGIPGQQMFNLYEKWGVGGFGIVTTGNIMVQHEHLEAAHNSIISKEGDNPERRAAFKKIAANCKRGGSLALAQLGHAGRQTPFLVNPTPFAPSAIRLESQMRGHTYGQPIELTKEQIKTEVVDRFVYAAKFAKECGFDGIEIYAAHGFLIAQFISPTSNKRTDEYGGSVENRVRVLQEIYQAIRYEIPASSGFVVGVKLNSVEFQDNGLTNDDAVKVAKIVEAEGFDFIDITGGSYEKFQMSHNMADSTKKRESYFGVFSKAIRDNLKNTVLYVTGGFRTVNGMINALDNGDTDGFGLGRPSCVEPDIALKLTQLGYQSTAINWADQNFMVGSNKGSIELYHLSKNTLTESACDPCHGHLDLSARKDYDAFVLKLVEYQQKRQKSINEGKILPEWFDYVQNETPVFENGLYGQVQA